MGRAVGGRAHAVVALLGILVGIFAAGSNARAFEYLEGRLQVHGYFEEQVRALSRNFSASDGIDLAQWYHVFNVEIDYEVAPDGWGPFDFVSFFTRLEARYDCVWTRACGLASSADAFGNRASRLPHRLSDARERGFVGNIRDGDDRHLLGQKREELEFGFRNNSVTDRHKPGPIWNVDGLQDLFAIEGPDGILLTGDDPGRYVFERFLDFRFAARAIPGPTDGRDIQMLGPWLPSNEVSPGPILADRANPFRGGVDPFGNPRADGGDTHPGIQYPVDFVDPQGNTLEGQKITPARGIVNPPGGALPAGSVAITDAEKPFRPAPDCAFDDESCPKFEARGLYIPNPVTARLQRTESLNNVDQNFRQSELEWNRGAAQQDEKELKELYVDLELFDSRLWVRAGKQSIVWGKTELFRTTDQFNPQDFGLATLPTLEESRIALWGVRGVWSFYDLGLFKDTRLELAFNFDQFEPLDLGSCGEPFTVNLVCLKAFGTFGHGAAGLGLIGELRPEDPWNDVEGLEFGARFEFRIGRFSFQVSDFWGYSDFPTLERVFTYERNVDPFTGMPRRAQARGPCAATDGDGDFLPDRTDPDCLQPGLDALRNHPANQTLFAVACAGTIGFNQLEPTSCGLSVLNSRQLARVNLNPDMDPNTPPVYGQFAPATNSVSLLLEGQPLGKVTIGNLLQLNVPTMVAAGYFDANGDGTINLQDLPLVRLRVDANDNRPEVGDIGGQDPGVDGVLTTEQEALLGCGRYYEVLFNQTSGLLGCHLNGIDLFNAEASILIQSWPGFDGTFGEGFDFFVEGAAGNAVPGTTGFVGGPVATRFVNGGLLQLPGARGPGDPGYDPAIDGAPPNGPPPLAVDIARHPFACTNPGSATTPRDPATCQLWRSELAALSWNFLVGLVMLSGAGEDPALAQNQDRIDYFDPTDPYSTRRCSFIKMHLCLNIQLVWQGLGTRRNTMRVGGRNGFGRRDFAWHQGGTVVIDYEKRNVLGFAFDFAEDVTKTNWSFEAAWIANSDFIDNDQFDNLSEADTYNLTVSFDRPTFINFLNANRTFFFNSQWFFQYINGYEPGFLFNGPWNVLGTFTVLAGYFQDRLLPQVTFVYDFKSNSGGLLSQLTYRFSERFSASLGINTFMGHFERKRAALNDFFPNRNRVGRTAYRDQTENLLSLFRDKDELFLAVRYTF